MSCKTNVLHVVTARMQVNVLEKKMHSGINSSIILFCSPDDLIKVNTRVRPEDAARQSVWEAKKNVHIIITCSSIVHPRPDKMSMEWRKPQSQSSSSFHYCHYLAWHPFLARLGASGESYLVTSRHLIWRNEFPEYNNFEFGNTHLASCFHFVARELLSLLVLAFSVRILQFFLCVVALSIVFVSCSVSTVVYWLLLLLKWVRSLFDAHVLGYGMCVWVFGVPWWIRIARLQ